jgi:hypothetical protein
LPNTASGRPKLNERGGRAHAQPPDRDRSLPLHRHRGVDVLLQSLGDRRYAEVLEEHRRLLRGAFASNGVPSRPYWGIRTPGGYQGWSSFISIPHKPQVLNPHGAG